MSRKQLCFIYGFLCFFLIWGWDLINSLKYNRNIQWNSIIGPFHFAQLIYILTTLLATRYIFKRYYPVKKYFSLVIALLLLIGVFILLRYCLEQQLLYYVFNVMNYPENVKFSYYALDNVYYAVVYIVLGTMVFLLDHQLHSQKNEASLKQESIKAELAFLRSQVSPHFLFNSLNNIYSLSYRKSDKAPDAILKLSELTRYMLYEKQDLIPLEKEWDYIQNFISLQQLRYEAELNMQIDFKNNHPKAQIAPYLLIPFVENAFKHGKLQDEHFPLTISLESREKEVVFEVKNSISSHQKDKDGGIGLENVRRRLVLLYPGKHHLVIHKDADSFDICLKINL
jgi:two-component system, LytTR family, sensor kinase